MVGQLQTETDVEATSHGLISDTIWQFAWNN